jgi:hypothetical protein
MSDIAISRRTLLAASAAAWVVALAPPPVLGRAETVMPDAYAAWPRRREDRWDIVCASRRGNMAFAPFSTARAPIISSKDGLLAPIGLARETIRKDFARSVGLPFPDTAFDGGSVRGDGVRVPIWIWADFA